MIADLARAQKTDRAALRTAVNAEELVIAIITGIGEYTKYATETYNGMLKWSLALRERFGPHVIRRGPESLDNEGNTIISPIPSTLIRLMFGNYPRDKRILRAFASSLAPDQVASAIFDGNQVRAPFPYRELANVLFASQNFYSAVRRAMCHTMFLRKLFGKGKKSKKSKQPKKSKKVVDYLTEPEDVGIPKHQYLPQSIAEWERDPSPRIDYLVQIAQQHLAVDNAIPLYTVNDDTRKAIEASPEEIPPLSLVPRPPNLPCDKIVLYSAFNLNTPLIAKVLHLFGFNSIEILGTMTAVARSDSLVKFQNSTRDEGPRILIISNVGIVGLNIPQANILVQMVSDSSVNVRLILHLSSLQDSTWSSQGLGFRV